MTLTSILQNERFIRFLKAAFIVVSALAASIPFAPGLPEVGLDPSWKFAMNQAVAQGLVFGRDIVFTFGPYASVYTKLYHPGTDHLMLLGGTIFGAGLAALLLQLNRGMAFRWSAILLLFIIGFSYYRDPLLLSYPLLLSVLVYRTRHWDTATAPKESPRRILAIAVLFIPMGLLPLIKGSLLPLTVLGTVLCAAALWEGGRRRAAVAIMIAPALSCAALWMAAGQPLSALPGYFAAMIPITAGYTEAMAIQGAGGDLILYVVAAIFIMHACLRQSTKKGRFDYFLAANYGLFLFMAWKAGFVRHDSHAIMAGVSLLIAALALQFISPGRIFAGAVIASTLGWAYIDSHVLNSSTSSVLGNLGSAYLGVPSGLIDRTGSPSALESAYLQRLGEIAKAYPIPRLSGTTDIYSYNQAQLIASGNTWSPRPIMQSYSAYVPALAEMNEVFLTGPRAPDNILFRVEPIDQRLPPLEDGLSWPTLLQRYEVNKYEDDILFLKKRTKALPPPAVTSQTTTLHQLGERIDLSSSAPTMASIDLSPSFVGRLASIIFKPRPLIIALELRNGEKRFYRLPSSMARAGFLLSPHVSTTSEFNSLTQMNATTLNDNAVKSIGVIADGGAAAYWSSGYELTLTSFQLPQDTPTASTNRSQAQ